MTKREALEEINLLQSEYVLSLKELIIHNNNAFSMMKEIDFTSPTGTGKTIMLAKLINSLPDYFFVVTTLSKGQLAKQIRMKLDSLVNQDNYVVFGSSEYTKNTIMQEDDILALIPKGKRIIWARDEGHIATNRWQTILRERSTNIINFSATNKTNNGIQCNFLHTMMLRTVRQISGSIEDALDKLLEVKASHLNVLKYNPCALFRVIDDSQLDTIFRGCEIRKLKYINITDEDFDITSLCLDDNEYDVIINKFKITEGIDLRRCHVIYVDNKPSNESTVVQLIGRARRNALFWRNDIDILEDTNISLLEQTRICYVFFNDSSATVNQNEEGELAISLCDTISVESLRKGTKISVNNGCLPNGLKVIELANKTGNFEILFDEKYHANYVKNESFYQECIYEYNPLILDVSSEGYNIQKIYFFKDVIHAFDRGKFITNFEKDDAKYTFYFLRLFFAQKFKKQEIDFDYWEDKLHCKKKDRLIGRTVPWEQFIQLEGIARVLQTREISRFIEESSEMEKQKALEYSRIDKTALYHTKKQLFTKDYFGNYLTIANEFYKYINKVEYYDISIFTRIEQAIYSLPNVELISFNFFKVSPHPFTNYLKSMGIETLEQIILKLKDGKWQTWFNLKRDYWIKLIKYVYNYDEIDNYDIQKVSLLELDKKFKLKLAKNIIEQYTNGRIEKKVGRPSFLPLAFCNPEQKIVSFPKARSHLIYRNDFLYLFVPYKKIINDYEISILGPDNMRYSNGKYIEDQPITSKISKFCKFNSFISKKYSDILKESQNKYFHEEQKFNFKKKFDSCLGYCVEYFAKIKLFGEERFQVFINEAIKESSQETVDDIVLVRAAMLIYKHEMARCFGQTAGALVPSIAIDKLMDPEGKSFVETVVELGTRTFTFVLDKLYGGGIDDQKEFYDPNLSVNHITGLCDFLTQDTILELKCTSCIVEKHLKQVLSYHYLSTKRLDLKIHRLIIYDAPTNMYLEVNI